MDEIKGKDGVGVNMKRHKLKDAVKDIFYFMGLSDLLLSFSRHGKYPKFLVLTYHRVCPHYEKDGYLGVPEDVFEQHMKFMRNNFKVVSMTDGLNALNSVNSGEIYAAINFDDGYMDNYLHAFPVLKKYKIPATVYLATDFIGGEHIFWWDRVYEIISSRSKDAEKNIPITESINSLLRTKSQGDIKKMIQDLEGPCFPDKRLRPVEMLGWKEIREMRSCGVDFGAHTKTHSNLCMLDDARALEELQGSKKQIEDAIGEEVTGFTYPFGILDQRVKGLVQSSGFKYARSTIKGFNDKDVDRFCLNSIGGGSLLKTSFLAARISVDSLRRRRTVDI